MPDAGRDLALLIDAAEAASALAMRYWKHDPQVWHKADDAGPVTEADLAVDKLLRETLTAARPDYGWLSEETADSDARLGRACVFIADPIDGTRAFVDGQSAFAISIAVVRDGQPQAGVVALPAKQKVYAAALGQGASLNGTRLQVSAPPASGARLLATRPNFDPQHWPGGVPEVQRDFRPSLAYRLALVAEGAFDGMLTLRDAWEWDIAAGALLVAEAGGVVSDVRGGALRFNSPHPQTRGILAAPAGLHASLLTGLGAA